MKGVLTDDEIKSMADESARFLPSTVDVYRNVGGDNQKGGDTDNLIKVGSVSARIAPGATTAALRQLADRLSVNTAWTITVPSNTDVESGDEIIWESHRFTVIQPMDRDYEVTLRLLCDEIVK